MPHSRTATPSSSPQTSRCPTRCSARSLSLARRRVVRLRLETSSLTCLQEPHISSKTDCKIPEGLEGQAWVYLTTSEEPLSVGDSVSRAAATNLCAGPAQINIINEVRFLSLAPRERTLTHAQESAFLHLFGAGLQYEHLNGAQCAINQVRCPFTS